SATGRVWSVLGRALATTFAASTTAQRWPATGTRSQSATSAPGTAGTSPVTRSPGSDTSGSTPQATAAGPSGASPPRRWTAATAAIVGSAGPGVQARPSSSATTPAVRRSK